MLKDGGCGLGGGWVVGPGHALDPTLNSDSGDEKIAPGVADTPQWSAAKRGVAAKHGTGDEEREKAWLQKNLPELLRAGYN